MDGKRLVFKICTFIALIVSFAVCVNGCSKLKSDLEKSQAYISALESNQRGNIVELNMTRAQLKASRDSINEFLDSIVKLKGYTKTITRVERVVTEFTRVDSIEFRDTIFMPGVKFDTSIVDRYYSCDIQGEYPGSLVVIPYVTSDLVLLTHTEKEYVNPRSKIFFVRWFQKKRKIYVTDVSDRNPFIEVKSARVIQIAE